MYVRSSHVFGAIVRTDWEENLALFDTGIFKRNTIYLELETSPEPVEETSKLLVFLSFQKSHKEEKRKTS